MLFLTETTTLHVTLITSVLFYCVYKYLNYYNDYWKDKDVPVKHTNLLCGLVKVLYGKRTPGKLIQDTYKEFPNDKIVAGFRGRQPELLIRDPELIKHVLVKDFNHFIERNYEVTDEIEVLNSNLFLVHGVRWKAMRQKFLPVFTPGKLRYMFPLVVEKIEEFQRFLSSEVNKNEEQEVKELMSRLTTDIIGSVAFGVKLGSIENVNEPFRVVGRQMYNFTPLTILKAVIRLLFPKVFTFLRLRLLSKQHEDFFINTVKEIIRQRVTLKVKRNDFIDLMLELKDKGYIVFDGKDGEERIEFSDTFMTAQAFIFFAAGFETSSAVMSYTLFELAKNPDVQKRVLTEIDLVLRKHHGKLSYDSIIEMEYLECAVNETMRKYPALANLTRVCTSKYTFPGTNLTIDEGVNISISTLALHYDPKYYPDPYKYIPERFSAEAKQNRHPMVFLPFGEGPRNCIGLRFGKMQSMIGIASILSKFTIHESPKTENKITINPRSFVTICLHGVWLKLKPRVTSK